LGPTKAAGMTNIESKQVKVSCSPTEVFDYLTDINNFQELLPKDKISNWESTSTECSFRIQGTVTLSIKHVKSTPHTVINLTNGEKTPFPFTLDIFLDQIETGTKVRQEFKGEINPFLKMMVEKPLANLFDYIADRLVKVKG
jgi:carbon monoxide dehydrogenase subunit G